jgi:hypothetical protein
MNDGSRDCRPCSVALAYMFHIMQLMSAAKSDLMDLLSSDSVPELSWRQQRTPHLAHRFDYAEGVKMPACLCCVPAIIASW